MDEQANLEMWAKGEQYHDEHLIPPDDALDYALKSSESKSLPIFMAVSKSQVCQRKSRKYDLTTQKNKKHDRENSCIYY